MIMATGNNRMVSIVSFYEMAIKINIEKLTLGKPISEFYTDTIENIIEILPITEKHLYGLVQLPAFSNHKDPFDRLIIATAIAENATVLSGDAHFNVYKGIVSLEWKSAVA